MSWADDLGFGAYDGGVRKAATDPPAGHSWRTIGGNHVLVNGKGDVVASSAAEARAYIEGLSSGGNAKSSSVSLEKPSLPEIRSGDQTLEESRASYREVWGKTFGAETSSPRVTKVEEHLQDRKAWEEYASKRNISVQDAIHERYADWAGTGTMEGRDRVQLATHEVLGVPVPSHLKLDSVDRNSLEYRLQRDLVRATYQSTQSYLKEKGVSEVTLWRGMKYGEGQTPLALQGRDFSTPTGSLSSVELNPASSFSVDRGYSLRFVESGAESGQVRQIMSMSVPAERVLSLGGITGYGTAGESEMVVLGGVHPARVVTWSGSRSSEDPNEFFGLKDAYEGIGKQRSEPFRIDEVKENQLWLEMIARQKRVSKLDGILEMSRRALAEVSKGVLDV